MGFFVCIATTKGPAGVRELWREDDPAVRSQMARFEQSHLTTGASAEYGAFAERARGILARRFDLPSPAGALIMEVDGPVDGGKSWQLGALAALALLIGGRLALDPARAERILWVTGQVNTSSLTVEAVAGLDDKLRTSAALFAAARAAGRPLTLVVPKALEAALRAAGPPEGATVAAVASVAELLALLGLHAHGRRRPVLPPPRRPAAPRDPPGRDPPGRGRARGVARLLPAALGLALAAAAGGAASWAWLRGPDPSRAAGPAPDAPAAAALVPTADKGPPPAAGPGTPAADPAEPVPPKAEPPPPAPAPPPLPALAWHLERPAGGTSCRAIAFARATGGRDMTVRTAVAEGGGDPPPVLPAGGACALVVEALPAAEPVHVLLELDPATPPDGVAVRPAPELSGQRPLQRPAELRLDLGRSGLEGRLPLRLRLLAGRAPVPPEAAGLDGAALAARGLAARRVALTLVP